VYESLTSDINTSKQAQHWRSRNTLASINWFGRTLTRSWILAV